MKTKFDAAARDERADGHAWRRDHDPALNRIRDAPLREESRQMIAAWTCRVADAGGREDGTPDRICRTDLRPECAGAHGDRDRRPRNVDSTAFEKSTLADQ